MHTRNVDDIGCYFELIRFGKILWLGDSKNAPSDEIISETHFVKDLEKDGSVSVEGFLGRRTQWSFVTEYACTQQIYTASYIYIIIIYM